MKVAELFAELKIEADPASVAKLDKALASADAKIQRKTKGWKKFASGAMSIGWDATQAGVAAIGVAAIAATKDALDFDKALTQLGINSQHALGSYDEMRKRILDVSKATGLAKEQVLAGAAAYTAITGDGKGAAEQMETFAKVATATGSSIEDIARTAAALKQNLQLDPKDFEKMFSILIQGGKKGSVELQDMATRFAELAPLINQFKGGSGVEGASRLAAGLQLAAQGFGSTAEAATGLKALMGSFRQNAGLFKKGGVKIFDIKKDEKGRTVKTLKSFSEIVDEISNSKLARDPALLTKAFGSKEAFAAFLQLTKNKGAWEDLAKSTLKATDVAEDYAEKQKSASFKAEKSWNNLKVAVAEAFTPERLQNFAAGLERILGITVKVVNEISKLTDSEYSADTEGGKSPYGVPSNSIIDTHSDKSIVDNAWDWLTTSAEERQRMTRANQLFQAGQLDRANNVAAGGIDDAPIPKTSAGAQAGSTQVTYAGNTINVTSNATDPVEVATQVDKRLQQHYRDAKESQGAGL